MSVEKLDKMIHRLLKVVNQLDDSLDLTLHRKIDQFYYMQKAEELKFLKEEYVEAMANVQRIQNRLDIDYPLIFETWKRDLRVLTIGSNHRSSLI